LQITDLIVVRMLNSIIMSVLPSARNRHVWKQNITKAIPITDMAFFTIQKRFQFAPKDGKMATVKRCSFGNDKFPRHVFMPFATEIITMKGESTCFFGDEPNPGNLPRQNMNRKNIKRLSGVYSRTDTPDRKNRGTWNAVHFGSISIFYE